MKIIVLLFISIIFFSCKKDEVIIPNSPAEEVKEQFIDAFSDYEMNINIYIHGHSYTLFVASNVQKHVFRLIPYDSFDGKFFYKIIKKSDYDFQIDPFIVDWHETDGLYRYDFENKLSYHYKTLEDEEPRLIMDFNSDIGDTLPITPENDYSINLIVTNKSTQIINNIEFPILKGYIYANHLNPLIDDSKNEILITPYYPNPIIIDESFNYYDTSKVSIDNFYLSANVHFIGVHGREYTLRNIEDNLLLSNVTISSH